jgi:hypothetical protein
MVKQANIINFNSSDFNPFMQNDKSLQLSNPFTATTSPPAGASRLIYSEHKMSPDAVASE